MSISEYAGTVEVLVGEMSSDFAALDAEWLAGPADSQRAAVYWEERLAIRDGFLDTIRGLVPPESVAAQHAAAVDVFTRITAADEALAARAAAFEVVTDHWQWVDTPEGRAADAILEEVFAFCRASQAEFDATQQAEPFADAPWIPSEMTEIVSVAFGCPPP